MRRKGAAARRNSPVSAVAEYDGTSLTDVSGYRICDGNSPSNPAQSILVSGVGVTSHAKSGLAPNTHYFAVATFNSKTSDERIGEHRPQMN